MPAPAVLWPVWSEGSAGDLVAGWSMNAFTNSRDALDFLVSRIAAEAESEGSPLSEIERKMLYFSETAPTPPDIMEANGVFDRDYNSDEYEKKIARLIGSTKQRFRKTDKQNLDAWSDAIRSLKKEDYYLLVMINQAGTSVRPRGDLLKLWATGILIVLAFLVWIIYFSGPR
jgi:hypothetical protein